MRLLGPILTHWQWLLEIGCLWVAFYGIYRLIRGTRSASVLAGLALVLAVAYALGIWFDMAVIRRVLETLLVSLPVTLVVLFQREMREGLSQLVGRRVFTGRRTQAGVIEQVVGAAENLSEKHVGGLIAIEHTQSHRDVDTGVHLDAEVSEELLENIFAPRTPLHDGAVWIRGTRVVVAGMICNNLTQREALHRSLGLRHRAALGISEETDAAVVVISEETGRLSLCHKGQIDRNLSPDMLRERLIAILLDKPKEKSA